MPETSNSQDLRFSNFSSAEDFLSAFLAAHPDLAAVEYLLPDPNGIVRGKWAPALTLKKAFSTGINFPMSIHGLDIWGGEVAATGLHIESGDLDGFCKAVPTSLSPVPWGGAGVEPGESHRETAQVILQTQTPEGESFGGCSRSVLQAAVDKCSALGLNPVVAFELEFFLLKNEDDWGTFEPEVVEALKGNEGPRMYSLNALSEHGALFEDIRQAAETQGLPIDTIVKEAGQGQFEINLNHRDNALHAADDVILLKRIVAECARHHNLRASFMAKPFLELPGNGMHVHISMLDTKGNNIFAADAGRKKLESAIAGVIETMSECSLLFINTRNGFRRMAPGSYAPTQANWGENNRSVAVRIPASPDSAKRLEHRISGADANPYLALAAILTAMLEGMEENKTPPKMASGNTYDKLSKEDALPSEMTHSIELFETSAFAKRALGEQMAHILTCLKKAELEMFNQEISALEHRSYI